MKQAPRSFSQTVGRKTFQDLLTKVTIFIFSTLAIVALILMFSFLIKEAYPAYQRYGFWHMYFSNYFSEPGGWGIWSPLLVTLFTSFLATLIATPIALRAAYFIFFRIRKGKQVLRTTINILAGVPSVVFGIFAIKSLKVVTNLVLGADHGNTILNGTLMLVIIILPTLIALILNQLYLVPRELVNSSLALGNTLVYVSYTSVKKAIRSGVHVAVIVALGRAIGETMALSIILISNSAHPLAEGLWNFLQSDFGTLGVLIAKNMFTDHGRDTSPLFAAGLALFVIIMVLVVFVTKISQKRRLTNRSPLGQKPWKRIDAYQNAGLYWSLVVWYYLTLPFKLVSFAALWTVGKLRLFFRWTVYFLSYPIWRAFGLKRAHNEPYSKYFARFARSSTSHARDYWRLSWEMVAIFLVMASVGWIVLDICIVGMSQYQIADWRFSNLQPVIGGFKRVPSTLLHPLVWTLVLIGFTIVIAFPFALCAALFLSEYVRDKKLGKLIKFFLDSLGGTPSILFGLFGAVFFIKTLGLFQTVPFSLLAGTLTMVLVILPTFTRSIEQVLIKIPDSYRQGSYALGASRTRTIFKVVIPQATIGIVSGTILSMGRIMGETAPIFLTLGLATSIVDIGILSPGHTLTTNILDVFANNREALDFQSQIALSYKIGSVALLATTLIIFLAQGVPWIGQRFRMLITRWKNRRQAARMAQYVW
ncbi:MULTISPECIES: ABC transporter permease subunit [unclassified Mycoplasma]|uniref:ABC transporter permease subunit n=1 Tax=unclassified Mycoplasma TaxID=2683645 RepID=UPI000FDE0401